MHAHGTDFIEMFNKLIILLEYIDYYDMQVAKDMQIYTLL